jgi:hypothetical protein
MPCSSAISSTADIDALDGAVLVVGLASYLASQIEGELALEHVVDLARRVPMHDRGAASGRHAHQAGEDRAAGLGAAAEDDELVGAHGQPLGRGEVDGQIDR